MHAKVPLTELNDRLKRFRVRMDTANPGWELAIISSNVNLYYFTGTMQDGILLIPASVNRSSGYAGVSHVQWTNPASRRSGRCRVTGPRQKRRVRSPRPYTSRPNRYRSPRTSGCGNISP